MGSKLTSGLTCWAHGAAHPVKSGYTGTSASGWAWQKQGKDAEIEMKIVPSRSSNRRTWEARLMSIVGALEHASRGEVLCIYVNDEEVVSAFDANFLKTDGTPYRGKQFWQIILDLANGKEITLSLQCAAKTDKVMRALKLAVSEASRTKLASMKPEDAIAAALPPNSTLSG